jgi:hypothetical protein
MPGDERMKISVNLATTSSLRERYALAWALPLALFGALGLVFLLRSAIYNYDEYHKFQSRLDAELQSEKTLNDREAALRKDLEQPAQVAEFQKAHFVNGLIAQKQFSLTDMTHRVSQLMPESVRLISLGVSRSKAETFVRFSVVGHEEKGLEKFIENIEDSPDFTELNVTNQSLAAGKLMAGMVGVIVTARFVGEEPK